MMKRMSRFLSALLVLAMLCALVPAAFAAYTPKSWDSFDDVPTDKDGTHALTKGDTFKITLPCEQHAVSYMKFTYFKTQADADSNKNAISGSYLSAPDKDGVVTANATTMNLTQTYVFARLACTGKTGTTVCTSTPQVIKIRVYDQQRGFTVKQGSTTLKNGDSIKIVEGDSVELSVAVTPATARQRITWKDEQGIVKVGKKNESKNTGTVDIVDGKIALFAATSAVSGDSSQLILTDEYGTKIQYTVNIIGRNAVTIKVGSETVVEEGSFVKNAVVTKDAKFDLTASYSNASGASTEIQWRSSDTKVVSLDQTTGKNCDPKAAGVATITALDKNGISLANFDVIVTDADTSLEIDKGNVNVTDESVDLANTTTLSAKVLQKKAPVTDNQKYAKNVVWSISDKNGIADFSGSTGYDEATNTVTGASIQIKRVAGKTGTATLTASLGKVTATVTLNAGNEKVIVETLYPNGGYTVRKGTEAEILERFKTTYKTVDAKTSENESVTIPVTWYEAHLQTGNKAGKVQLVGALATSDAETNTKYTYEQGVNPVTVEATLTDDIVVSKIDITAPTKATAGEKITLTAKAVTDPSDCAVTYKWYLGTKEIGTGASCSYTIPTNDGTSKYDFSCTATATKGSKTATKTESVTVNVARDYTVEVALDSSTSVTVGKTVTATATVYDTRNGGKTLVSNPSVTWELKDSNGNAIDAKLYSVNYSGAKATITFKATDNADGQKISLVAKYVNSSDKVAYTSHKEITLSAAKAASITMSIGDGATVKSTTINTKAAAAVNNSSITLSYVKFGTPKNCTLTKSASSSTSIGSTACYFSTTTGQKLSDVYAKLDKNATSGSVTYTVYDSSDNAVVTGTINFDSASSGNITCLGVDLGSAEAAELIAEEFPDAEYVKFDALDVKYGRLLLGYKSIVEIDEAKDVKDTDKLYLKNSSSVDSVEDLYLLPRTDYYGAINLSYTAYSSSNKSLGEGKLTFTVTRKTSSSKFTDVTASNVGSWAADAIDFMATNGLVGGVGNNKFNPTGTMTRCDLVLIMYRMAGEPSVTGVENIFTDVKSTDYFYKAVLWAYDNGVVNGTGANTFSPKSNITREQIASILYRYSGATTATGSISSFDDAAKVSGYATTAMKWAVGAGIIGGSNNKLDPQGNATRAQVAVMLHRFLNK